MDSADTRVNFTDEELATTLRVLQGLASDPSQIDGHQRFKALVTKIHKAAKRERRQNRNEAAQTELLGARLQTGVVRAQQPASVMLPSAMPVTATTRAQRCYVCKEPYHELHHFYHLLCPACAGASFAKREPSVNLQGRIALVTGGRIKIGFQTALCLLRNGAQVIVTTRFPQDAARRFLNEPDAHEWKDRLTLEALDLRHLPSVEALADRLQGSLPHLDILINNAAQTVKRPREFYAALMAAEPTPWLLESHTLYLGQMPGYESYFSPGEHDVHGQLIDKRPGNSWSQRLHEVSTLELLEVQLVNAVAPFMLTSRLKPALDRSPHARRFVVQASAMEGQFNRHGKTEFHPHTNMAKASLNMLVRTSAQDWARDGIYMNAVDTGWITDERPYPAAMREMQEQQFFAPLDVIDGMARLVDPIVRGINEVQTPLFGHFLKDFRPHDW
jgi:NAD(P)-dependent dehydrogenase (short-subunit alcohol dehydrogenase family)